MNFLTNKLNTHVKKYQKAHKRADLAVQRLSYAQQHLERSLNDVEDAKVGLNAVIEEAKNHIEVADNKAQQHRRVAKNLDKIINGEL